MHNLLQAAYQLGWLHSEPNDLTVQIIYYWRVSDV